MRRPPPFYCALRGIVSSRVLFFLLYFGLGKKSSSFIFSFISLKWLAAAAGSAVSSLLPGLWGVLPCHRRGTNVVSVDVTPHTVHTKSIEIIYRARIMTNVDTTDDMTSGCCFEPEHCPCFLYDP
jgi:hypothetical protein